MTAKNLVLTRIGKRSLHRSWAAPADPQADWDLAVSTYEAVPDELLEGAAYRHHAKGGKWDGVFAFFRAHPGLLDRYDYFWIPDDDITTGPEDVTRLFELVRGHDLELAQPSLTLDSYHYHHLTLHNAGFGMRRTNFVELMVPVFHRDLLKKLMHMFEGSWAGLGFDMIWPTFTSDPRTSIGIIDDVIVKHNGELASFLYGNMREAGIVPMVEYRRNAKRFGIRARIPMAHGGIRKGGREVRGRIAMTAAYIANRVRQRRNIVHNPATVRNVARLIGAYFESYRHEFFSKSVPAPSAPRPATKFSTAVREAET